MQNISETEIHVVRDRAQLEARCGEERLAAFLHEHMKPYEDPEHEIRDGVAHALSEPGGGFALLAEQGGELVGALVMLRTGMRGYVPENLLLFVGVHSDRRGRGLGGRLVRRATALADGDVKLHVERDNPARHLYERLGFGNKYAEMRWCLEPSDH